MISVNDWRTILFFFIKLAFTYAFLNKKIDQAEGEMISL